MSVGKNPPCSVIVFHNVMCVSLFVKSYLFKNGWTPLFVAAVHEHLNVVKYLLEEAKVNPNQPTKVGMWIA